MKPFKRAIYKQGEIEEEEILSCSGAVSAQGQLGIYEVRVFIGTELGYTGIQYDSYAVPDRFQIIYDGNVVADSKYVGSTSYFDRLAGTYDLDVYEYDQGAFVDTGSNEQVVVTSNDISNGSPSEPTSGQGVISFNRTDRNKQFMTIRVTGVLSSTLWNLESLCPQPTPITFSRSYLLSYGRTTTAIDCTNPPEATRFYLSTDSLRVGTVIYTDRQKTKKAPSGYYLYGAALFNFDGNTVIDSIPCSVKPTIL